MATSMKKGKALTPQQERFCQLFVTGEEFLGNGTKSYAEAYGIEQEGNWYKTCAAAASRLLRGVKIANRISEMLNLVMNDQTVDNELGYVIAQKADLNSKVAAIREYNKLKKRVSEVQVNDVKILVLPNTLLQKNAIPVSIPEFNTRPRKDSSRQTQVSSNSSR